MAKYNQIRYGSSGDDVKKLQNMLNSNGYTLDTGATNNTPTTTEPSTPTTPKTTPEPFTYDPFKPSEYTEEADRNRRENENNKPGEFQYGEYEPSELVRQAEEYLRQHMNNKPGEYQSNWQSQIDDILNRILNREKFSYDLNGDALYQQYKDQFTLQGQQAMMDTMGQAQAMTGGYGNTYAQSVGQQAYQAYLQQLNDRVPELYQLALDQYNREGEQMYNQYGLLTDQENQDYGRYRDKYSDYWNEYDRYTEDARYQDEKEYGRWADDRNFKYGQHRDQTADWQWNQGRLDDEYWNQWNRDYGQYSDNRNFDYGQYRDRTSDEQWQAQFDEAKRQFDEQMASKGSSGGYKDGSGDGRGSGENSQAPEDWSDEDIIEFQGKYGLDADGIWGPKTQSVYDAISDLNAIIANNDTEVDGADNKNSEKRSAIIAYLNEALEAGDITDKVYQILRNEYAGGSSGGRYTY